MFKNIGEKIKKYIFILLENIYDIFITYRTRPALNKNYHKRTTSLEPAAPYAIIIQGPIVCKKDFTLETIRIYKKIFKGASIIVSTWEGESNEQIEKIKAEKAEIILNKKPIYAGNSNINYQILSTKAGINRARTLGANYIFKTRTDQRIYGTDVFNYFLSLLEKFPVNSKKLKYRIIASSLNTYKYRPYSISDMFFFGHIDDISLFWNVPEDGRKDFSSIKNSVRSWVAAAFVEAYLVKNFLLNIGHDITNTLEDGWYVYGNYFCIIDQRDIDLYWFKYDRFKESRREKYDGNYNDEELSFKDWLILYSEKYDKAKIPEEILDKSFSDKI